LRLLLDTADISPTATAEQRASYDRFMRGGVKATPRIQSATIDIHESRFDRVLLSVIDTPGLDFQDGRELKLERQVSSIMKYLDGLYADTMSEVRYSDLFGEQSEGNGLILIVLRNPKSCDRVRVTSMCTCEW
jgi:hypothetical protein